MQEYFKVVKELEGGKLVSIYLTDSNKFFRVYKDEQGFREVESAMCFDNLEEAKLFIRREKFNNSNAKIYKIIGNFIGKPVFFMNAGDMACIETEDELVKQAMSANLANIGFPRNSVILKNCKLTEEIKI